MYDYINYTTIIERYNEGTFSYEFATIWEKDSCHAGTQFIQMFRTSLPVRRHKESHAVDDAKQTCFIEIGLRDVRVAVTYEPRIPSVPCMCYVYSCCDRTAKTETNRYSLGLKNYK